MTHSLVFPFLVHCSGDHDMLLLISGSKLSCISLYTLLRHILWPFFLEGELAFLLLCTPLKTCSGYSVEESELAWFSMCTLLVIQTVAFLLSESELALFCILHSSGDTKCTCLVLECELAWFLMFTLLVTQTVACLVSASELA